MGIMRFAQVILLGMAVLSFYLSAVVYKQDLTGKVTVGLTVKSLKSEPFHSNVT